MRDDRDPLGALHGSVGNQAVKELHERGELQPKLDVSRPGDPAEREAERAADEVLARSRPTSDDEATPAIRRSASAGRGGSVTGTRESRIRSSLGSGKPLPGSVRSFFESRFGRDFSDVRVHTGPTADEAARSIGADAFTLGSDVAFANGNYRPGSRDGKRLLAHELAHVAQQGGAASIDSGPTTRRHPDDDRPGASRTAVARAGGSTVSRTGDAVVQRETGGSDGGDGQSSRRVVAIDADTTFDMGEYSVSVSAPGEVDYIPFAQVEDVSALDLHRSVVTVGGEDENIEMAILDLTTGQAIHAKGLEEFRDTATQLKAHLRNELGYPNAYAFSHLQRKLLNREDFHVGYEYLVWYDEQAETSGGVERPSTTGTAAAEGQTATFPNVSRRDVGNAVMFFMQLSGFNPPVASALYSLHTTARMTGQTYAIGVSGGAAPFIAGGDVGTGYAFFPDGGVGVYGSGSVDFGVQVSAGVNLDFTAAFGGIDVFTGEVITTSVTIGPVSGSGLCAVEMEDGLKTAGELVGVSFSGGLSLGLEILAHGTETTTVL